MRVLVDALPARDGGGVTYLIEEIRAIESVAPDVQLELLVAPWSFDAIAEAVRSPVRRVSVKTIADRFAFEQTVLRRRSRDWDVLYCPINFGPILFGGEMTVLTLHNPNYFGRGLTTAGTKQARPWVKVKACHAAIRECRIVVAISDAFREEVVLTMPEVASKLRVVKSGGPQWERVRPEALTGLPERFLLAVSSGAPHKRLEHVVAGWADAVRETGETVGLVIVAGLDSCTQARHRAVAGSAKDLLVHLGAVHHRGQLRWLYQHATAMVSMSVLEAFPLTIGEAGALGCPLVLSDIPPHREVSLGNATFVAPNSPSALAGALREAFMGEPGSRPWRWPVSWEEHGGAMVRLFRDVAG